MNVVLRRFTEDVLAVGIDRMEAGKAFLGYFFRRHSQRNVFQNLCLSLGEVDFSPAPPVSEPEELPIMRWQTKRLLATQKRVSYS